MNLNYIYYYFTGVLKDDFINRVRDIARASNEQKGSIGSEEAMIKSGKKPTTKDTTRFEKLRDSNVAWIDQQWLYDAIHPYVQEANEKAGWNFEWHWTEPAQYTIYRKGQHYDWHQDSWPYAYEPNRGTLAGKVRKLSVTCNLTDPKEYSGGELEFYQPQNPKLKKKLIKCKEILPKGSIIVFPSFIWHRVTPVTKGKRTSLVMWNLGKPFE